MAQGSNFGIGLVSPNTNDNVIENNTVVGNSNGIFLTAGVQGNVIRGNVIAGNPPVQLSIDFPLSTGFDIQNLAADGANTFDNNICLSSVNAPCPAIGIPPINAGQQKPGDKQRGQQK